jgi:HTH-type transcriptional regulator/antitoxin HigA
MEGIIMSTAKNLIKSIKEETKFTRSKISGTYLELVELFPLRTIESEKDHKIALSVVEKIMNFLVSEKNPDEGIIIYLKTLSDFISDFENSKFKSKSISGKDMLAYLMDLQGLNQSDLAKEVGGQPIVSKILKGERELNLRQIKALAKRFKVSPEVFI